MSRPDEEECYCDNEHVCRYCTALLKLDAITKEREDCRTLVGVMCGCQIVHGKPVAWCPYHQSLESRLDSARGLLREVDVACKGNMDATMLGGELEDRISEFVVERQ